MPDGFLELVLPQLVRVRKAEGLRKSLDLGCVPVTVIELAQRHFLQEPAHGRVVSLSNGCARHRLKHGVIATECLVASSRIDDLNTDGDTGWSRRHPWDFDGFFPVERRIRDQFEAPNAPRMVDGSRVTAGG